MQHLPSGSSCFVSDEEFSRLMACVPTNECFKWRFLHFLHDLSSNTRNRSKCLILEQEEGCMLGAREVVRGVWLAPAQSDYHDVSLSCPRLHAFALRRGEGGFGLELAETWTP